MGLVYTSVGLVYVSVGLNTLVSYQGVKTQYIVFVDLVCALALSPLGVNFPISATCSFLFGRYNFVKHIDIDAIWAREASVMCTSRVWDKPSVGS